MSDELIAPAIIGNGRVMDFAKKRGRPLASVDQHLTVDDVARLLVINRDTVYTHIRSGAIGPIVKIGRLTRIPAKAINRFIEERSVVRGKTV